MNARLSKKMTTAASLLLAGAAMAGCAGRFAPETDATSPIAPRVQQLVDANRQYPRWADFPKAPEGLPQPVEVAAQVNTLRATSGALAGEVSRLQWTLEDPETFAAGVASRVDASQMSPVTAQTQADVEAFAQSLRDRAKAPPPIPRR